MGLAERFERLRQKAPVVVLGTLVEGHQDVVVLGESKEGSGESIFEIGSITKTFTALLLAEMCHSGEVALSDPVSKFIPAGPDSAGREITLLNLATHTARLRGVPRDLLWEALRNRTNPYARYDRRRLEEALDQVATKRGIGQRFRYSNFGFATLGYALEKAAGVPYDEIIVRRICEPLGLTSTSPAPSAEQADRYLTGHKRIGKPVAPWDLASFGSAGVLKSSIQDMLTYLEVHLHPEGVPLAKALGEVQVPRVQIKKNRLAIGLGWLITTRRDQALVWHGGETGGFSSFAGFNPRAGVALVALANARVAGPLTRVGLRALEQLRE